jgi:CO/xanthine dehydrogenase Mo-binding subunit
LAAEALGIDYDMVETAKLNTALSPDGGMTCASRMTYLVSNAATRAAQLMIGSLLDEAASTFKLSR